MPDARTPDPATAALAEWRKIEQAAKPGPWHTDAAEDDLPVVCIPGPVANSATVLFDADWGTPADAAFIVTARTAMPRLLSALDKVLELVAPPDEIDRDLDGAPEHGMVYVVSCDEVREAITREVTGEESSDGN